MATKPKKKNPRLASGRKRVRQDVKLNAANTSLRSKYRTAVKNVEKAVAAGDKTKAAEAFARAQSVVDGSDAAIGPGSTALLLVLVRGTLRNPDAKVAALRWGRDGAICGAVELRNRMGTYTGGRPFVFEPASRFVGRLPEGPELRNPASVADYAAMERAKRLFSQNCAE